MRCEMDPDCPHEAQWAIKMYVPAKGFPANPHTAIPMIMGVRCCRKHAEGFTPANVMDVPNEKGATMRNTILPTMARAACAQNGRPYVEPDCDRAWIVPLRMNSDEYQAFLKMTQR